MADEQQSNAGAQQQEVQFNIQRIYTKDISFETPNSPAAFQKEWKPEIKLDIDTRTNEINSNLFEVILSVTVTATNDGDRFTGRQFARVKDCARPCGHGTTDKCGAVQRHFRVYGNACMFVN